MTVPTIFSLGSKNLIHLFSTCSRPISHALRALSECFATCVPITTRAVLTCFSPLPQPNFTHFVDKVPLIEM